MLIISNASVSRAQASRTKLFSFRATLRDGGHAEGILYDVTDEELIYTDEDPGHIRLVRSGYEPGGRYVALKRIRKIRIRPLARNTIGTGAAVGGAAAGLITWQTLRNDQSTGGTVFNGLTVGLVGGIGAAVGGLVGLALHAVRGRTLRPATVAPERSLRIRLEPYCYRFRAGVRPNPQPE